jgi:hypothetical protein
VIEPVVELELQPGRDQGLGAGAVRTWRRGHPSQVPCRSFQLPPWLRAFSHRGSRRRRAVWCKISAADGIRGAGDAS